MHFDADAFFASVEQAMNPALQGKAVIVGGAERGVVSAASYEARRFGISSAMPIAHARRKCPHGIFLCPNFKAYKTYSHEMFSIVKRFSPCVEITSIDEGYIDLTGSKKLHRAPYWVIGDRILREIRETLRINVSGALAQTRVWAKIATQLAKPNGLFVLLPESGFDIIKVLPVNRIPGVGKKTDSTLSAFGIHTIQDLTSISPERLTKIIGAWAPNLLKAAKGIDSGREIKMNWNPQKSYSADKTLEKDCRDWGFVHRKARELLEKLTTKLRRDGKAASTITIKIRYNNFEEYSRSLTSAPTNITIELLKSVDQLFWKTLAGRAPIRLIGVKLSGITDMQHQPNLFDKNFDKKLQRDKAMDRIRLKYGAGAAHFG